MGFFRFRRSIKLFPGVRWNLGSKSSSLSFGGRGAHYTIGPHGTRSTFGIPGTGLSYTDIHSSHARVNSHAHWMDVPAPSAQWIEANKPHIDFHFPDRQPGEPQAQRSQIKAIQSMGQLAGEFDWNSLGKDQADNLLAQMQEAKSKYSKQLLRRYYREQGASVPTWLIDHVVDHPGEPIPGAPRKSHGCLILIGILLAMSWLSSLSKKEESAPQPPAPPQASLAVPSSIPSAPSQVSGSKPPGSSAPASNSQLPDPKYWPKEVRISAPVVLSGSVDGGTIRQTAKPGAVIDATLSDDHHTVTLRRMDISGTLPIEQTDFLDRAHKAQSETP